MEETLQTLKSVAWWLTVVVAGIIVNLFSQTLLAWWHKLRRYLQWHRLRLRRARHTKTIAMAHRLATCPLLYWQWCLNLLYWRLVALALIMANAILTAAWGLGLANSQGPANTLLLVCLMLNSLLWVVVQRVVAYKRRVAHRAGSRPADQPFNQG